MSTFGYTTQPLELPEGSGCLAALTGSVDPTTIDRFRAMQADLLEEKADGVALEFSGVKYINSTGIDELLTLRDRLREHGHRLVLLAIPAKVMLVMDMLGLREIFTIVEDEDQARAALAGEAVPLPGVEARLKEPAPAATGTAKVACGHCHAKLKLPGAGKYRCPRCGSLLAVGPDGSVETFREREREQAALEVAIPALPDYVGALDGLLLEEARACGLDDTTAAGFSAAVRQVADYMIREALQADPCEHLRLRCAQGGDGLEARVCARGRPLPLKGKDLSQVEAFATAAAAVDRIEFEHRDSENRLTLLRRLD